MPEPIEKRAHKAGLLGAVLLLLASGVWWLSRIAPGPASGTGLSEEQGMHPARVEADSRLPSAETPSGGGAGHAPAPERTEIVALTEQAMVGKSGVQFGPEPMIWTVRGRVVDGRGQPLTDFRVNSRMPREGDGPAGDGLRFGNAFEWNTRALGAWPVKVEADGYVPVSKEFEASREEEVEFVLVRACGLHVRVLDPAGGPVPRAAVRTEYLGDPGMRGWHGRTTDEQGEARWPALPLGRLHVSAVADGVGSAVSEVVELSATMREKSLLLVMTRGAEIRGVVYGQPGEPEPGLRVRLSPVGLSLDEPRLARSRSLETEVDGSFSFVGLPPGRYRVKTGGSIFARRAVPQLERELDVLEGERAEVLFTLFPGNELRVQGRVLRDGEPFAGVRVHMTDADPRYDALSATMKTDLRGRFELVPRRGGRCRIDLTRHGRGEENFLSLEQELELPASGLHELEIAFATGVISGRVVDSSGAPVPRARLKASAPGSALDSSLDWSWAVGDADEEGRFALSSLAAGRYEVSAATAGGSPRGPNPREATAEGVLVTAGGGTEGLLLVLSDDSDFGTFTGVVTTPDGQPAASARLDFRSVDRRSTGVAPFGVDTNGGGLYRVTGVVAGDYRVRAQRDDLTSAWATVEAAAGAEVRRDLLLEPGAFLSVRVEGALEDQRVHASIQDPEGTFVDSCICENSLGRIGPVLPGEYSVSARAYSRGPGVSDRAESASVSVTLAAGKDAEVLLSLE